MSDQFVGQIIPVAFDFAPVGWLPCDGRSLLISEYDLLYALLGTTFGGDGVTNFNLPNLNGRAIVGVGQSPGGSNYQAGQAGGSESVTLNQTQLGSHTHALGVTDRPATTNSPGPAVVLAMHPDNTLPIYGPSGGLASMAASAISVAGGGQDHENRQPFLVINYIIATVGLYPSQS
jgi:microcystin-dependent protein